MGLSRRSFPTAAGWSLSEIQKSSDEWWVAPSSSFETRACRLAARRRTGRGRPISRCQTAHLVPAARFCARGLRPCFAHPEPRGGRSAEKRSGASAPVGRAMTRHVRRLARRLASHNAGRSPLGAPPWRFWAPGAALPSPWAPAVLQRRAGALRIRAASSSHPGRSAWRAGSLPPEASGYEPPPQDATPRSAFRIVSRTRPQ
jgi:hypothetical protein